VSVSRRHLLAKLSLLLPAAAVLAATTQAQAAQTPSEHHKPHGKKSASAKHSKHTAQAHHHAPTVG
jgi:hypothetical protein